MIGNNHFISARQSCLVMSVNDILPDVMLDMISAMMSDRRRKCYL